MNRSVYFDFIEERLNTLANRIESRGKLNILNLNLHSENFYLHFLNLLFGWKLENLNINEPNVASIDLIDESNKIIIQVSSVAISSKIANALSRDLSKYKGYSFKFVSISKDASGLREKNYKNPNRLNFFPTKDIFDVQYLLKLISASNIDQLKKINDFIKKELKSEPDTEKTETNIAVIILTLSKEDWSKRTPSFVTKPYEIETKIAHNNLEITRELIVEYAVHYPRIDKIYSEFNAQGANKSLSILDGIHSMYLDIIMSNSNSTPDQIFFLVIDQVIRKVQESANYTPMPEEELELCVQILVVDAFIRCKIFRNPSVETNANSG